MGTHGLPESGYVHDVYTITNADKQAYSHYFVHILMGVTSLATELKLAQIEFLGTPRVVVTPADSVLKGCMGPLNSLGQSYTYPESSKGLGCVVGYRQRQIYHSGFVDTNSDPIYAQANLEPQPIRDIPSSASSTRASVCGRSRPRGWAR